ncbi:MAG: T9SS type A sorting domain-containing protein [Bacteroidia bacterium]|nr:T9SS type A sorting domain-containing protein [Bacteroidia bacterium]
MYPEKNNKPRLHSSVKFFFLLVSPFLFFSKLIAQPQVSVLMRYVPGFVEVVLIPDGSFDGVVSNFQLTLTAEGVGGGPFTLTQPPEAAAYIPMQAAGSPVILGNRFYQKYAGFGLQTLNSQSVGWIAGGEYVIMRLPIATVSWEPGLDNWTMENNGQFYVELNGKDRTGSILGASKLEGLHNNRFSPIQSVKVFPNPSRQDITLNLEMTQKTDISASLWNYEGRQLWLTHFTTEAGGQQFSFSLPPLPPSVYLLKLETQDFSFTFLTLVITP